jgi:hypothetical protein
MLTLTTIITAGLTFWGWWINTQTIYKNTGAAISVFSFIGFLISVFSLFCILDCLKNTKFIDEQALNEEINMLKEKQKKAEIADVYKLEEIIDTNITLIQKKKGCSVYRWWLYFGK